MTILAHGEDYFGPNGFRIQITHPHVPEGDIREPFDLTEIAHYHDFTEMVVVLSGTGIHWVEGHEYIVRAGDVFLFQGEQKHYFKEAGKLDFYNLMFDPDKLQLPTEYLTRIPGFRALFLLEPTYRVKHRFNSRLQLGDSDLSNTLHQLKRMESELKEGLPGFEASLSAKLVELMVFLGRRYSEIRTTEGTALLRVSEVIGALEQDYTRSWTLKELTKIAHISESRLLVLFREATMNTPIEYLIKIRVSKAKELLLQTDHPIDQIAMKTGFSDSNYFSRQFRKGCGISPREFRKKGSAFGQLHT
ncbi:hypothetical protein BVY04_04580 [bacterium M21]|nr:hypothetical protein BVY04_04580 [bacterium M21]